MKDTIIKMKRLRNSNVERRGIALFEEVLPVAVTTIYSNEKAFQIRL